MRLGEQHGRHTRGRLGGRGFRVALSVVGLLVTLVALPGCDPLRAPEVVEVAAPIEAFDVVETNLQRGTVPIGQALAVQFSGDIDAGGAGNRSVRVLHASGRPLRRARAWATGDTLYVAPQFGHEFPRAQDLVLRVEGLPSPRALRSADGRVLARRTEIAFRVSRRRVTDLSGPQLVTSAPQPGATDVAAGSSVELVFSEALRRASVKSGDAVRLFVDGVPRPARLRLSQNLLRLVIRPRRPLPPGADVRVEVQPALLDLAGNPARSAVVEFATREDRRHELVEEFVTTESRDADATTCAWGESDLPGSLVARLGRLRWSPLDVDYDTDLGERRIVRFQVVYPVSDAPGATASALRVEFRGAHDGDVVFDTEVRAGVTFLDSPDPSFEANRSTAELATVASLPGPVEIKVPTDGEASDAGVGFVEIPFDVPLSTFGGEGILVDVSFEVSSGLRVAASTAGGGQALVEGAGSSLLLPAAELLVGAPFPQARSLWMDTGLRRPHWYAAKVSASHSSADAGLVVEFQTASAGADGAADPDRASEWESSLERVPQLRFVRFRVRFEGLGSPSDPPRIDSILLPYRD